MIFSVVAMVVAMDGACRIRSFSLICVDFLRMYLFTWHFIVEYLFHFVLSQRIPWTVPVMIYFLMVFFNDILNRKTPTRPLQFNNIWLKLSF